MRPSCKAFAITAVLAMGTIARAAPPTVTPSPGYDARLQASRAAAAKATPEAAPATPRHHKKPKQN